MTRTTPDKNKQMKDFKHKLIQLRAGIWDKGVTVAHKSDLVLVLSYGEPYARVVLPDGTIMLTQLNSLERQQMKEP